METSKAWVIKDWRPLEVKATFGRGYAKFNVLIEEENDDYYLKEEEVYTNRDEATIACIKGLRKHITELIGIHQELSNEISPLSPHLAFLYENTPAHRKDEKGVVFGHGKSPDGGPGSR